MKILFKTPCCQRKWLSITTHWCAEVWKKQTQWHELNVCAYRWLAWQAIDQVVPNERGCLIVLVKCWSVKLFKRHSWLAFCLHREPRRKPRNLIVKNESVSRPTSSPGGLLLLRISLRYFLITGSEAECSVTFLVCQARDSIHWFYFFLLFTHIYEIELPF